jgi:predicted membrane protein
VALASFEFGELLPVDGWLSTVSGLFLGVSFPVSWILGQGLLLKWQYGWSFKRWILGTLAGALLAMPLLFLPRVLVPVLHDLNLPGNVIGTILGLLVVVPLLGSQMWVLRRYVRRVWLWPIGTLTGLAIGSFLLQSFILPLSRGMTQNLDLLNAANGGSQGLGFGLVTGLVIVAMVRLTRNRQQPAPETQADDATAAGSASQRLADAPAATLAADRQSTRKKHTASL